MPFTVWPATLSVTPEVFGAGVLSAGEVYRGCFAADGRTFLFFKKVGEGEEYPHLRIAPHWQHVDRTSRHRAWRTVLGPLSGYLT